MELPKSPFGRSKRFSLFLPAALVLLMISCSGGGGSSSTSSNTGKKGEEDLEILTESLPSAEKGKVYQAVIEVSGGLPPYVYTVTEGSLPPGLNIDNSNGLISGRPEKAGRFNVATQVIDSSIPLQKASKSFTLLVTDLGATKVKVNLKASVTKGVAPLSVFFDASGTTSPDVTKPFHHLLYRWDFGDSSSKRPTATGPLAVHVFQKPGSYTVKLTVRSPKGEEVHSTKTIVVEDPDKVYSGANTICFSNDGDFTGAPAGAKKVRTNDFRYALTYAGDGKRLLFKRGDTYTVAQTISLKGAGPCTLGAYGKGVNPDERGIYSNNPVVWASGGEKEVILNLYGSNLRIMDLTFATTTDSNAWAVAIDGVRHLERLLLLRVRTKGTFRRVTIGFADDRIQYFKDDPFDQITFADCRVGTSGINDVYMGATRLGVLGSLFEENLHSHVFRLTFCQNGVIEGNTFEHCNPHRHLLKLHSRKFKDYGLYTEKVIVSGNSFYCNSDWPVALGPQDSQKDERVRDVILEKNTFFMDDGLQVAVLSAASDLTVRNNVFLDRMTGGGWIYLVSLERRGIEPLHAGGEIYNNTYYGKEFPHKKLFILYLGRNLDEPIVANNLLYSPKAASGAFEIASVASAGQKFRASKNLVSANPLFKDPAHRDFSLGGGSPAVDYGSEDLVPVMEDYLGRLRPMGAAPDAGAYESH